MKQDTRYRLALASYWLLFVLAPAAGLFVILGGSRTNFAICFCVGWVLMLVGEHAFRLWKRLWKVED